MKRIRFYVPAFFMILSLFTACGGEQAMTSSDASVPADSSSVVTSNQASSPLSEAGSSAPSSDASSQETSDNTSSQENIFEATPPLEDDDFVLYNDSGEKVWWLNQKFKARESSDMNSLKAEAIPGTRYIGRRELRQVTPEEVYFYDVYKFENDVTTIFAFNYVGADMRDMENCYIHGLNSTDPDLITNRGIRVGDTRKDVVDMYGINNTSTSEFIIYEDANNLFDIFFIFKNDIVIEIDLSYFPSELQYVEYPDTYI